MVSFLDIAGTYVGPGAYNYNVAGYPGGAVLFVNSATGTDNRGRVTFIGTASGSPTTQPNSAQGPYGDPNKPLATVFGTNGAISFCKAGRGDTIIVSPGHTENIQNAGAITVPAGITVVGGGYGTARPTFTWKDATSFIQWGGAGGQFQNLIFDGSGFAAVTKMFLVAQTGIQFVMGKIIQASSTNQATDAIVLNAGGDDCLILGTEIDASAAAGCARAISNPTTNNIARLVIANSYFHGDYSGGNISLLSTASTDFLIEFNTLRNYNATQKTPLALAAGNTLTGIIANNDVMMGGTGQSDINSGGGGTGIAKLQNFAWSTKASTASGILIPAAGTL